MRIVFLTGSHPRHAYVARSIEKSGFLVGLVIEKREEFVPSAPDALKQNTKILFNRHFSDRQASEMKFFKDATLPNVKIKNVELSELNSIETANFINKLKPDLLISYGVHKLNSEFLNSIKSKYKWNVHGGLSPWYRGVITHFWPSYFLEPQMTGMTVHELTQDIDGGRLIHQSLAELVSGDGIHDLSCRAVFSLGSEMKDLLDIVKNNKLKESQTQNTTGRIWRSVDWQPSHLHLIYDYYDNKIVDHFLSGSFDKKEPKIFRQF